MNWIIGGSLILILIHVVHITWELLIERCFHNDMRFWLSRVEKAILKNRKKPERRIPLRSPLGRRWRLNRRKNGSKG